ncbi:MAG: N-formylglutamate amidohydrolase [Caulobacteraceae bacterium]|nr:N-formylglutamate amidohydrolase [Caulobacteraceae bacterium]
MTSPDPLISAALDPDPAPFVLTRALQPSALVFASPHSGRHYPASLMEATRLDGLSIRQSEDGYVDRLIAGGPTQGASLIAATYGRAYLDVNRSPLELDPDMFEGDLPPDQVRASARVSAGLGVIAKVVAEGQEIYRHRLAPLEAQARLETVHGPYHAALSELLAQTQRTHGLVVLIDWHSMPSAASGGGWGRAGSDFVLGDRHGTSCGSGLTRLVDESLTRMGYQVARNNPYAGGYTTEHYGQPSAGIHALQIEINRRLYLNEAEMTLSSGFASLKRNLDRLIGILVSRPWADHLISA